MELDFAILAQNAEPGEGGKIHIFGGGFDVMAVDRLPAMPPPFAVVARLILAPEEVGRQHFVDLDVTAPDGNKSSLLAEHQIVSAARTNANAMNSYVVVIIRTAFQFSTPGIYAIRLSVDGRELKSLPVSVSVQEQLAPAVGASKS